MKKWKMLRVLIIFAFGEKKDHSINEFLINRIRELKRSAKKNIKKGNFYHKSSMIKIYKKFPKQGLNQVYHYLEDYSESCDYIVSLGGSFVEGRFEAYKKKKDTNRCNSDSHRCYMAVIDSQRFNGKMWFDESNHSRPAGYIAAKICAMRGMRSVAFIGGARLPVVEKWALGFYEGVKKYKNEYKIDIDLTTEYIGKSSRSFQDIFSAYHITRDLLKWKKPSVIMQVCGTASKGVTMAINEYNEQDKNDDCFIVFTDFAPSHKSRKSDHSNIIFSVIRELQDAIAKWIAAPGINYSENVMRCGKKGPRWDSLINDEYKLELNSFSKEWEDAYEKSNVK